MTGDTVQRISRILVPLELSRLSEGKVPTAEAQAWAFAAQLVLLHVIPSSPPEGEAVTNAEAQARTYLNAIASRLRADGLEAHYLIRHGPVAEVIVEEIAAQGADLVVLGTNVRRGLSRLLPGSVAEAVIAEAPCPVLLVRPDLADAEKPLAVRSFADDVARAGPVAPRTIGIRTVEVARIVGSVGRAPELDEQFRSRNRTRLERQRYEHIRVAMEHGESLPPIVLYKLGYGYYVVDGNHRVAAAKELGQLEMESEVTEFVPLGDPQTQRVFAERRGFEQVTGLTRIGAARPGNYPRIEELIHEFAAEHGFASLRDAARVWEAEVYRPVARRIRTDRLGEHFPDERTADVFLALCDFREEESAKAGRPLDWEEALTRFHAQHEG